ncbi:MAG: outer membrane lipoprotein carrier protein LolA [Deltaproteobacteria bacterium]|nr:outer membrane lipoprotein carrier protein LolA [Deltaproteobacteria bacterium]MBW2660734.1 outer membrane lipoprotein carrier protein LolA [Deltaproteobacteria bacterium]
MKKSLLKRYAVFIFSSLILFLNPCHVFPSESNLHTESELIWVIKNMKNKEKSLKTLTAKFAQIKNTRLLKEPLYSEGIIYFDSEGKMLFEVTSPSSVMVLIKSGLLLIYYPDISKTKEKYIGSNFFKKYLSIGQSIEEFRKQYSIQLVSKTNSGNYHLKLIPKNKAIAKRIDMIEIEVKPAQWLPEKICFKEQEGDYTSIHLEFTSINKPLPAGIFRINAAE